MRVLLVEDDRMIGKAVHQGLGEAGFSVDWVTDGREADLAMSSGVYHAVVLDLGLPRTPGLDVLRTARARGDKVPVLIATARDALADRVDGLNSGADDYIVKPFHLEEVVARLHALIRRRSDNAQPLLQHGPLVVDPLRKTVTLADVPVELSAREFAVLETLMQQPGAVLSCTAIEEAVYGWDTPVGSNAIEVHLHHLRKKLGAEVIKNVRGVGYRIGNLR